MSAPISFNVFIERLSKRLKQSLPGELAHRPMEALSAKYLGKVPDESTRECAVLIVLFPYENKICFPLILRRSYAGFHSGEVSFPGGKYEPSDKDLIQTALREAKEEIGLVADHVQVLGTLTKVFIGPSNFIVLPVVGYIPYRPMLIPDEHEVEQIFEIQLDRFTDAGRKGVSEILIPGDRVQTPYYDLEGHQVWGATAKIISELLFVTGSNRMNIKK